MVAAAQTAECSSSSTVGTVHAVPVLGFGGVVC
jgi:hypothetical protein